MALGIVWTKVAETQLEDTIEYLESNWTHKEISKFFKRLEEALDEISKYPQRSKLSQRKVGAREHQLSRHTTIFYTYTETTVAILVLWSNKKNPQDI